MLTRRYFLALLASVPFHHGGAGPSAKTNMVASGNPSPSGQVEPPATNPRTMTEAEQTARANPAGDVAYAWRNIRQTASGKIDIEEEFRLDLRKEFTDAQIARGLERAPARLGAPPVIREALELTVSA
jgi:hypothetical protein